MPRGTIYTIKVRVSASSVSMALTSCHKHWSPESWVVKTLFGFEVWTDSRKVMANTNNFETSIGGLENDI